MISSLTALFIIFAVVIGSTAMVGVFAYILSRVRRLESGQPEGRESKALAADLDQMRDEMAALRDDVAGLTERLDFTERLLMEGKPETDEAGRPRTGLTDRSDG
jgi:hypothetical protein